VHLSKEWRLVGEGKNLAFIQGTLNIIFLYYQVLLKTLNSKHFFWLLVFSEKYLMPTHTETWCNKHARTHTDHTPSCMHAYVHTTHIHTARMHTHTQHYTDHTRASTHSSMHTTHTHKAKPTAAIRSYFHQHLDAWHHSGARSSLVYHILLGQG